MKIVVCIKQVPNTTEVKFDPKTGTLIREGLPTIINPEDKNALEEALAIAATVGGQVTVLSMGPAQADYALREALAMGAHEAVLLSDRAFAGADTWATSYALSKAIEKLGEFSLILCGRQAIDGDTAQVGPELAEHLDIPHVTYVKRIVSLDERHVVVERALEDGYEVVESTLPALLTAVKELNAPRYPSAIGIVTAFDEKKVTAWTAEAVGADPAKIGLKGSPTQVKRTFTPSAKDTGKILTGTHKEAVQQLIQELCAKHVL
ncbi:MAG: electron transfer flavoprotein subunit beta/FixA family protein [Bacillota bacterium]|nr:electron transfer flavoprotein subunit beta/FixA family protein [Bacillota bacterium]